MQAVENKVEALDIFEEFATDETLENEGTYFEIGKGTKLLIARSGNRRFAKALAAAVQKHDKVLSQNDEAAEKLSDQIMVDVLAETILLGWENVNYRGKPLDYSVANAKMLLAHKEFRRRVSVLSEDVSAYKAKLEAVQGEV